MQRGCLDEGVFAVLGALQGEWRECVHIWIWCRCGLLPVEYALWRNIPEYMEHGCCIPISRQTCVTLYTTLLYNASFFFLLLFMFIFTFFRLIATLFWCYKIQHAAY